MRNYWKPLLCAAMGLAALTACEDVPAPYNIPTENQDTPVTPSTNYILNQTFTSSLGEFNSVSIEGDLKWTASSKYGAIISGYDDWNGTGTKSNKSGSTLLESPTIDLTEVDSAYLVVDQAINYAKTTLEQDHKIVIGSVSDDAQVGISATFSAMLSMSFEGLGSSFTYVTQYIQIPSYYMGSKIRFALSHIAHNDYSSTWEVKSLKVAKGTAPSASKPDTPVEGIVGAGTKEDPYDVPSTLKIIAAGAPSEKIYTKGKVSKVDGSKFEASYGTLIYYISNDGSSKDQLEVYRGYGLGGAKFTSATDLKVGDDVIVYGQVVLYNSTPEFTTGSQLYSLNGQTAGGNEPSGEGSGNGTKENPYNVIAAMSGSGNAWVKAYIVGWIEGQKLAEGAHFDGNASVATNLLIADNPDETNVANCMPVQLPTGDIRSALNLKDNPGNYKKEVMLYGSLEKYFGAAGLKSVSDYVLDGSTPEPTPTPEPGDAKGNGSLEDPFNSVKANEVASALASGAESTESYYIKGKVVSIKEAYGEQYGNGSFYISDDGTTAGQFLVYHALYLGNKKWVSGQTQPKAGDDVIVYGKLTNYKGNTPETVQNKAYLYSLNGQTEAGETPDDPDPQPGGDAKTLANFTNGDFETWTDDSQPTGWKSASSASNATLAKSTDAHGGSYAVCVKGATSGNKRLAYEEMELESGTYTCSFWTKAATDAAASLCPGYAIIGSGNPVYKYNQGEDGKNLYVNDIGSAWQQVTYSFDLTEKSTVCLIVMNSKTTGTDLLIDDFTISKK